MELNKFNKRLIASRRPFSVVELKNDPRITNVNGKQSSYNIVGKNGSGIAEFGCDELAATWFCEAVNRYAGEIYSRVQPTNEQETHEAVGNAAKLRKALVRFYEWAILDLNENAWIGDSSGNYKKLLDAMAKEIAAALAAPTRNCDRFASAEEAWDAYDEWADSYRSKGKTEPFNEIGWLFAPATEGGDNGNE